MNGFENSEGTETPPNEKHYSDEYGDWTGENFVSIVELSPNSTRAQKIREALLLDDESLQVAAVEAIQHAQIGLQQELYRTAENHPNPAVQEAVSTFIE